MQRSELSHRAGHLGKQPEVHGMGLMVSMGEGKANIDEL